MTKTKVSAAWGDNPDLEAKRKYYTEPIKAQYFGGNPEQPMLWDYPTRIQALGYKGYRDWLRKRTQTLVDKFPHSLISIIWELGAAYQELGAAKNAVSWLVWFPPYKASHLGKIKSAQAKVDKLLGSQQLIISEYERVANTARDACLYHAAFIKKRDDRVDQLSKEVALTNKYRASYVEHLACGSLAEQNKELVAENERLKQALDKAVTEPPE